METSLQKRLAPSPQLTGSVPTHWKCAKCRSHQCKKLSITFKDALLNVKSEHNHQVVPRKSVARQLVQQMKTNRGGEKSAMNLATFAVEIQAVDNEVAVQIFYP